ncbi:MAG: hypothetical protein SFZ24_10125 [Planctomycetota bacterium]|nr:hypothetical protein [Planctomycetota bacterium]
MNVAAMLQELQGLVNAGRLEEASGALAAALRRAPANPDLHSAMCYVLVERGVRDGLADHGRKALAAKKGDAAFLLNLGRILARGGEPDVACECFERVIQLSPKVADAYVALAGAHFFAGRIGEYERSCRRGLEALPDHPRLLEHWAAAVRKTGRAREAYDITARASGLHPTDALLLYERAFNSNYPSDVPAEEIFAAHAEHGRLVESRVPAGPPRRPGPDEKDRPLRVGFLSPDLRKHSVAFFAEPMLESLGAHGISRWAYFTHSQSDERTERFRALCEGWCDAAGMSDDALSQRIAFDRIDILIDLDGLMAHSRLGVLARRPAPVQATYLGYPNTTGLTRVDWRIVDSITDPPGVADALATERLMRIDPCFLCYRPAADAPPVEQQPALSGEPFMFGSFNALTKLSDRCVDLWSRLLLATPGSRLLMKNYDVSLPEIRAGVLERFQRRGVEPERLELIAYSESPVEHLKLYGRVDLALDTYPYHGTTTTCEAFHQGVPVLTLQGNVHASRVSGSLLSAVGLERFIAHSEDEFVSKGVSFAASLEELAAVRGTLRERMRASPLGDVRGFGGRFAAALRAMWRDACDNWAQERQ